MTVDDLMTLAKKARTRAYSDGLRDNKTATLDDMERAGVTAIVRALRDEFGNRMKRAVIWDRNSVAFVFNEILGTLGQRHADCDAGEKVAGGSTREDGRKDNGCLTPAGPKPATDAAPAVCEITAERDCLKAALAMVLEEHGYGFPLATVLELRKALEGAAGDGR